MARNCNGCLDRPLDGGDCEGLVQTLSVNTGIENYIVQVCANVELVDIPPRFHELEHNGTGTVVVHQPTEISHEQAETIAQGFDL